MVKSAMKVETQQKNQTLNPINNTKARRLTYLKRKYCIKKKTMELGILCGTDTCTVILGPNGDVETWPENPTDVKSILGKYREHLEHGKEKPVRRSGEKDVNPHVSSLGWDDHWVGGFSPAGELWSLLGDLDLKLEAVENRVGFLNKEQGNGFDSIVPLGDYWPVEQSVFEPSFSGFSCFPLNTQPLGFYGHQLVPVAENNHLQPFSMDEKTLLSLGNNGFMVEPSATPSGEGSDGDSNLNVGFYANDYAQEFVPRDEFYSQISPLDEALWGTVNSIPMQFVDNEHGEGAAFNFNNGSFQCSQGELQLC